MNAFEKILALPPAEKKTRGLEHTPAEIAHQPDVWLETADLVKARQVQLRAFLAEAGVTGPDESVIVLTGAGTSEFIGNAIAIGLRERLQREVQSIPTTHLVTHAAATFVARHRYTVVSFARSGNSPESLATFNLVRRQLPEARQLVITCNPDGALAKAAQDNAKSFCLVLPAKTNDRSLAMTSSFSSMALTGLSLAFPDQQEGFTAMLTRAVAAARRILAAYANELQAFAGRPFSRACYLGSGTLTGTMQEIALKMQEMTDGAVACRFDSFLGLRHGPQVFVKPDCVVVAALASDPSVRRYELDLLRELRRKAQGCGTLVICDRATDELGRLADVVIELFPRGNPIPDDCRVLTDVVAGQMLALFKSLHLGLKPDSPSPGGIINRVVQGVTIYEP